jgi:hypothetical protein
MFFSYHARTQKIVNYVTKYFVSRRTEEKNTKWLYIATENAAIGRTSAPAENSSCHSETVRAYA